LALATEATALLRFLSPANFSSRLRSYSTPLGLENLSSWQALHLEGGEIRSLSHAALLHGRPEWSIDVARKMLPGLLEAISDLSNTHDSEFKASLFDALLVYGKNSLAINPADKLIFVLSSLEAVLLRDSNEAIQTNLAERIAFLIGNNAIERKDIIKIVKETYAIRSKFVHHGQSVVDSELIDSFLEKAWNTFARLIEVRDVY
jgi:hypothetical protein